MAPNTCRKTNEELFQEVTTKKGLHDLCGRKFVDKSRTTTFWASLGKFSQKFFAPPNLVLPTPMHMKLTLF